MLDPDSKNWILEEIGLRLDALGDYGSISFDITIEHRRATRLVKRDAIESIKAPKSSASRDQDGSETSTKGLTRRGNSA